MGFLNALVVTAILVSEAAELPPPFPRAGTTSISAAADLRECLEQRSFMWSQSRTD